MMKFRVSRLSVAPILACSPVFVETTSIRRKLKSVLLCGSLAMAGLAQAGALTVTSSNASTSLSLTGNGASAGYVFSPTISADTANYNLRAAAVAAGWNQTTPLQATVTINAGVVVYASSTANYAFDTGASFPAGSTLKLNNNGYVIGMGGAGGATWGTACGGNYCGFPGLAGGPALRSQSALQVVNNGIIAGGGGGGGGGGTYNNIGGGGGGGRTGRVNSAGGAQTYFYSAYYGTIGSPGTFSAAGAGGTAPNSGLTTNAGGTGGDWGATGGTGAGDSGVPGGAGGAGGAAVVGNANITWTTAGTRLGALN